MVNNDLINELGTNFIEYAAAVNTDRAIPDATSGLKPVARRILWGAFEKGYLYSKPHVKSAKIVGDVMGSYHPHGDSSIYGALIRLSQNWVMRYPLIDVHGNNGNIAGDGAAHMRYTEARLSKLSEDGMLFGIKKKNVPFIPNYSEDIEEPTTLPAIFPNLLCNPNTGIGVAMACNWLPHNLNEVAQAIYDYMDGKEPMLLGPDFPTGGIVINSKDIPGIIKTGHGTVRVRAKYKIEKSNILVFYEIPYGTAIEALLTQIGEVCDGGKIEGITDVRDESNKKGLRIVVQCQKGINPDVIANKLFQETDLQSSISYNQVALVDKTPTELGLKQCIEIYLKHNINCLVEESKFDLNKAQNRLEVVNGLLRALEDIDNIIAFIKASKSSSTAKDGLVSKYNFTEAQAKAIVDMKLGRLAGLEKIELNDEKTELDNTVRNLNELLSNIDLQKKTIRERLADLVKKYGDARRTELLDIEVPKEDKEIETVIPDDVVVIISKNGNIKRIDKSQFRIQKKGGKGVKTEDDAILDTISTNTIDTLLLFTNKGLMYRLLVDKIPVGSNTTGGTGIGSLINLQPDENVIAITNLDRKNQKKNVVFVTKNGVIKKTLLEEYINSKRTTGIVAIKIKDGDSIASINLMDDEEMIIVSKQGMSIHIDVSKINAIGRATTGVIGMKLKDNDEVIAGLPVSDGKYLATFSKNGYGKMTEISEYPLQNVRGIGVTTCKISIGTGELVGASIVNKEDVMLLIGKTGICISSADIPILGRATNGNILVKGTIDKVVKL